MSLFLGMVLRSIIKSFMFSLLKELPHWFHRCYTFSFPGSEEEEGALFFTASPALNVCRVANNSLSDPHGVMSHCAFALSGDG